jgi:hypothetical protein
VQAVPIQGHTYQRGRPGDKAQHRAGLIRLLDDTIKRVVVKATHEQWRPRVKRVRELESGRVGRASHVPVVGCW